MLRQHNELGQNMFLYKIWNNPKTDFNYLGNVQYITQTKIKFDINIKLIRGLGFIIYTIAKFLIKKSFIEKRNYNFHSFSSDDCKK